MSEEIKAVQETKKKSFLGSFFGKFAFSKTGGAKNVLALDETIKKLIYVLVFLIPLWFLPSAVNAIEFNKQALMVLLVVITLILWLVKILNQGKISWKSNILNIFIGAFLVISILATIFSLRSYGSLIGWPTHLSGSLINILGFLALYILVINNFRGLKETFGLLFAFLISSGIASLIGLVQLWGGFIFSWDFAKVASFNTIGTVNTLGIFAATILSLITALLFVVKKSGMKIFLVVLGLINLLILISINFWLLWVVLGIGMIIVLIFGLMRIVKLEESVGWIALPMVFLAISLIFIFFKPTLPLSPELPTEVGLTYRTGFDVVKSTLKERPILGTGPETFALNYGKYKPEGINQTLFWNIRFSNPPSEFFSIISDLGILGAISFLILLIFFIIKAVKNLLKSIEEETNMLKRFLEIGLFAAWFGLAVSWFLYPQNFTLMFTFWLFFAIYLAESAIFKEKIYNLRQSAKVLLLVSFSFVVVVVLVVGVLYIQGTRFVAEARYKSGLDLIQIEGKLDEGLNKIIRSTVINPYEDRSYRILSQIFILKLNRDMNLTDLDQQQRANIVQVDAINAINSAVRATTLSPYDVSNWLVRAQTYRQVVGLVNGADDWAESSYEEAIKLDPLNPFSFTELGRIYVQRANLAINQGQGSRESIAKANEYLNVALEKFNQAIIIKPDYAPAHFETARIFDAQGRLSEAISRMEINRQLLPQDAGVAFQLGVLYYKAEKYNQAKGEFIRAIVINPDFSNARYFLGLLYDRENNKEDALDQFERIAKLNPDNEHVKDIIGNLRAGLTALGDPDLGPPKQPEEIPIEKELEEENKEVQP